MKRVFAHIGFSFALTLIVLNLLPVKWVLVILAATGALFIASISVKKTRVAGAIPLCFGCAVIACLLFMSFYSGTLEPQLSLNGKSADAEFYLIDIEEKTETGYYYTVKTKSIDIDGAPQNIKLSVKSDNKINADYFQILKGKIKFTKIADNGFKSYGSFGNNIFLYANLTSFSVQSETINSPMRMVLHIKENIKSLFEIELGGDNGGLALALVTGMKDNISTETISDFKVCGASHIMAVSGLHLAVVAGSVYLLLKKLFVPKFPRVLLSFSSIAFYAALSGFSKSVLRAGIMMTVLLIARVLNEKSDSLNSLGIAVFIICFNPFAVTDTGALLTVTAVLGLILIVPQINKIYRPKRRFFKYIYDIVTASLSVFITTFPIMYFVFGSVSLIGVVVNIIMIPVAQFTLVSAFLMIIFQYIAFICKPLTLLCKAGTNVMLATVKYFSRFSFAVADISSIYIGLIISAVMIMFGISFIIRKKGTLKICTCICTVMIIIMSTVLFAIDHNCIYVRVLEGYNSTAVFIYDNENAVAMGISDSLQYYTAKRICEAKGLDLSLIIDTKSSPYSEKLTLVSGVKNYAVKNSLVKKDLKCDNLAELIDFDVDLWDNLNIKYHYGSSSVEFTVYNTAFEYKSGGFEYSNEIEQIYSDSVYGCDIIYAVNDNGFAKRSVNQWQK